mgnify:CR=1 FL=1
MVNSVIDKFVATKYNKIVATKKRGGNVAAIKKGTKLTDNPKDYMLRVRIDKETLSKLDEICKAENTTRSEIIRKGIMQQYQKK